MNVAVRSPGFSTAHSVGSGDAAPSRSSPLFERILLGHVAVFLPGIGAGAALAWGVEANGYAGPGPVLAGLGVLALLATVLFAVFLHRALAPLEDLARAAERAAVGNLATPMEAAPIRDPWTGRLAAAFDRLLGDMAADRQRLRDIAARAFRAQEAERARLADELQENTAQTLSSLLLGLRIARQAQDPAKRNTVLDELREDLSRTVEEVRGMARALRTPVLGDLGVVAAIESYVRALARGSGPEIALSADDVRGALAPEGELALYRTVQEALANAVRHARAGGVSIRVRRLPDAVEAVVEDDGCGFAPAEEEARKPCLGLFGMRERALYAGGSAEVESEPGFGTRVRILIPVEGAERGGTPPSWPTIFAPGPRTGTPLRRAFPDSGDKLPPSTLRAPAR